MSEPTEPPGQALVASEADKPSLTATNSLEPLQLNDADAVVKHTGRIVASHCADCGAVLGGLYCAMCGQHRMEPPRTFWALMAEWISAYFNLEGKLWTTLRLLVTQPGELSLEYFRGRRTRYFPPLKMYLTMSVIFFSAATVRLAATADSAASKAMEAQSIAERRADLEEQLADVDESIARIAQRSAASQPAEKDTPSSSPDSDADDSESVEDLSDPSDELPPGLAEFVRPQMRREIILARLQALNENRDLLPAEKDALKKRVTEVVEKSVQSSEALPLGAKQGAKFMIGKVQGVLFEEIDESFEAAKKDSNEKVSRLIEDLASASPKALFFFLPVFAGVYAFMFRRTSFYVESFVFTLHLHSFFLALAFIDMFIPSWPATLVMMAGMAWYTWRAVQRVYAVGRFRALSVTLTAMTCYLIIFSVLSGLTSKTSLISCALGGRCG